MNGLQKNYSKLVRRLTASFLLGGVASGHRVCYNEEPRRKQRGIPHATHLLACGKVEIYFTGGGHTYFVLLHNSYLQTKFNRRKRRGMNPRLPIKRKMSVFTDYVIQTSDYEFASECSNECRRHGIQGSHTDFLLCAVAIKNDWKIFTSDNDFFEYRKYLPIKIFE